MRCDLGSRGVGGPLRSDRQLNGGSKAVGGDRVAQAVAIKAVDGCEVVIKWPTQQMLQSIGKATVAGWQVEGPPATSEQAEPEPATSLPIMK